MTLSVKRSLVVLAMLGSGLMIFKLCLTVVNKPVASGKELLVSTKYFDGKNMKLLPIGSKVPCTVVVVLLGSNSAKLCPLVRCLTPLLLSRELDVTAQCLLLTPIRRVPLLRLQPWLIT